MANSKNLGAKIEILGGQISNLEKIVNVKLNETDKKTTTIFNLLNDKVMPAVENVKFVRETVSNHVANHWRWVGIVMAGGTLTVGIVNLLMAYLGK